MSLKALLALGLSGTRNGVIVRSTPHPVLYGAKKLAKTRLTVVLDNYALGLYIGGMLRGFAAFPLYASLIRYPQRVADTALVPSGCLPVGGTGRACSM